MNSLLESSLLWPGVNLQSANEERREPSTSYSA